jgi:Spy/CpxP family protein refolding chaperone
MSAAERAPRRVQLLTALVILATFVAGAATGMGVARWARPPHPPPPPPAGLPPLRELDLSPEQDERARQIAERHREELEGILRETFPRVRAVHEKIEAEVRGILTPEQQRRLDEIKARRPPPRGGPPPHLPPPH